MTTIAIPTPSIPNVETPRTSVTRLPALRKPFEKDGEDKKQDYGKQEHDLFLTDRSEHHRLVGSETPGRAAPAPIVFAFTLSQTGFAFACTAAHKLLLCSANPRSGGRAVLVRGGARAVLPFAAGKIR